MRQVRQTLKSKKVRADTRAREITQLLPSVENKSAGSPNVWVRSRSEARVLIVTTSLVPTTTCAQRSFVCGRSEEGRQRQAGTRCVRLGGWRGRRDKGTKVQRTTLRVFESKRHGLEPRSIVRSAICAEPQRTVSPGWPPGSVTLIHREPRNSQLWTRESGGDVGGAIAGRSSSVLCRIWSLEIGGFQWRCSSEFGDFRTHERVRDMRRPTARQGRDEPGGCSLFL